MLQTKSFRSSVRTLVRCGLVLLLSSTVGCHEEAIPTSTRRNPLQTPDAQGSTDLRQGLDILRRVSEFNPTQAHQQILTHFQQWLSKQPTDTNWQPDEWVNRIPDRYQGMVSTESLSRLTLEPYDAQVLQEATWLRDIARTAVSSGTLTPSVRRLLGEKPATDLQQATLLAEWVVTNLQLDETVTQQSQHRLNSDVLLYPWESILLGRGTAAERTLVFIMLGRQLNLPIVALAINSSGPKGTFDWLPALISNGQLYLFEMRLGTPVPNADRNGIATLADLQAHPEWLETLEVFPDFPYPVEAEDLQHVVAMIDAPPHALSRRMALLEGALSGDNSLSLTVSPSKMAQQLADVAGLQGVAIWPQIFQIFASRNRLQSDRTAMMSFALEHSLFDQDRTPLYAARTLHFRGQLDNTDDQLGARVMYLESRRPDGEIRQLVTMALNGQPKPDGSAPTPEELERNKAAAANLNYLLRRTKQNASYWLGTMALDQGKYDVAIDFLEKRVLAGDPATMWQSGATFNLGRAYEAQGRLESNTEWLNKAIEVYRSDRDSASAAADFWHAQQLEREFNLAASDQTEASETAEPTASDRADSHVTQSATDKAASENSPRDESTSAEATDSRADESPPSESTPNESSGN